MFVDKLGAQADSLQRLWTLSDIHVDYKQNFDEIRALDKTSFRNDTLILAGDTTDRMDRLQAVFEEILERFGQLVFVPGNHELWVRHNSHANSIAKWQAIVDLCEKLGVITEPLLIGEEDAEQPESGVWVVPLLSWYHGKGHADTLYGEKPGCEDHTDKMWSDFFLTTWPADIEDDVAQFFLDQNASNLQRDYRCPVVSVSHFLPRQDLMLPADGMARYDKTKDPYPEFNFSGVAGTYGLERQLRALGSRVHIYGHQHRNRIKQADGVTYVSHCMGYPKERAAGMLPEGSCKPLLVWDNQQGLLL